MSDSRLTWISIDFDGTLVEPVVHAALGSSEMETDALPPIQWRPWAREFLLGLARTGAKIWLHSCRCSFGPALDEPAMAIDEDAFWEHGHEPPGAAYSWALFEQMRAFLMVEGVWEYVTPWTRPGKPFADHYVDDRGETPNFLVLAAELGVALVHADQGPAPGLGQPGSASPGAGPAAKPAADVASSASPGLAVR